MSIERSDEDHKYHIIKTEDVLKYGMQKACILGNLDKIRINPKHRWHENFPYIQEEEFYKLLNDLIDSGVLREVTHE